VASQLARRWILQTLLCQAPAILAHSLQLAIAISLSEAQANLVPTRPSIAGRSAFRWRPANGESARAGPPVPNASGKGRTSRQKPRDPHFD
jgi:hypothetical protein